MEGTQYITIQSGKKEVTLDIRSIRYVKMSRNYATIHVCPDKEYETRRTMEDLEQLLGENFIKVHRSTLVSVMAIHEISDKVYLSNGKSLNYTVRKKKQLEEELEGKQKRIIESFRQGDLPQTEEAYHEYYRSFDNMPFAFTDIEMIFNEENHAVDWIFRYGNEALAKLEKIPLDKIIGNSFGSLFSNMDSKWVRSYERAALFGEELEIIDYSPEIDTYLDVICFPTFKGHCGCILLDFAAMTSALESNDSAKALMLYMGKFMSFRPQ